MADMSLFTPGGSISMPMDMDMGMAMPLDMSMNMDMGVHMSDVHGLEMGIGMDMGISLPSLTQEATTRGEGGGGSMGDISPMPMDMIEAVLKSMGPPSSSSPNIAADSSVSVDSSSSVTVTAGNDGALNDSLQQSSSAIYTSHDLAAQPALTSVVRFVIFHRSLNA